MTSRIANISIYFQFLEFRRDCLYSIEMWTNVRVILLNLSVRWDCSKWWCLFVFIICIVLYIVMPIRKDLILIFFLTVLFSSSILTLHDFAVWDGVKRVEVSVVFNQSLYTYYTTDNLEVTRQLYRSPFIFILFVRFQRSNGTELPQASFFLWGYNRSRILFKSNCVKLMMKVD